MVLGRGERGGEGGEGGGRVGGLVVGGWGGCQSIKTLLSEFGFYTYLNSDKVYVKKQHYPNLDFTHIQIRIIPVKFG